MNSLSRGNEQLDRLSFDPLIPSVLLAVRRDSSARKCTSAIVFEVNIDPVDVLS
jgi:hypothetical protein